jgi:pimeloyl-ACP methyl ester carboxylesterase/DNA-binding SARP family transcriptional activator
VPHLRTLAVGTTRAYTPAMSSTSTVEIKLFGGLEVRREGEIVALPQSKKTRALLGYLILKGTPQRRDALCELLWEIPDDPRASLRWSLSKLRPLVNDEASERLTADRERVAFERCGAAVDVMRAEQACAEGLDKRSREELLDICRGCTGTLLAGLDLPSQPAYESWRLGAQERARQLHLRILDELIERGGGEVVERTALMRQRIELDPDNADAHLALIAHLVASGRRTDAEAQAEVSRKMLAAVATVDEARFASALQGAAKPVPPAKAAPLPEPMVPLHQDIRFCTASDGVRIAYATVGSGPPLVKTANWMNHLEFDWESPVWRHVFRALSSEHTFIRYDSRGNGLSDWDAQDLTLDAFVKDLKAVVDAAGVDRFPLLGISQGCAISVEFAVRWPERVSKLILYGGYARGWRHRGDPEVITQSEALITLTRTGWGRDNPAYRQVFTSLFLPKATPEQADWFNELQRITTSPDNAARIIEAHSIIDVRDRLHLVTQPTLVLHARNDARIPLSAGRELAMGIPNARFATVESENHLILEQEPAWPRMLAEIRQFLAE